MIEFTFENFEEVKQVYDPAIVDRALQATIKRLTDRTATETSRKARDIYNVKHRDITVSLKKRVITKNGVPVGNIIYSGKRLSLRYFSGGGPSRSNRPRINTSRGVRYGAKARIRKGSQAKTIKGAFWGTAKDSGEQQIFQRLGLSRLKIKKLTGPSISHMIRGDEVQNAVNKVMAGEANEILAEKLDHFIAKKTGLR